MAMNQIWEVKGHSLKKHAFHLSWMPKTMVGWFSSSGRKHSIKSPCLYLIEHCFRWLGYSWKKISILVGHVYSGTIWKGVLIIGSFKLQSPAHANQWGKIEKFCKITVKQLLVGNRTIWKLPCFRIGLIKLS
jgi:hypothetical protein